MSEQNPKPVEPILTRRVRVTIEKEFEIKIMPSMLLGMTEPEYIAEFCKGLWNIESMDDVVKYAARAAAYNNGSDRDEDGLGRLGSHPYASDKVPDVIYREIYDECEEEILPEVATC